MEATVALKRAVDREAAGIDELKANRPTNANLTALSTNRASTLSVKELQENDVKQQHILNVQA